MTPYINRKAAAFRRGGFLLFAALILGAFAGSVRAEGSLANEITDVQREEILREFVLANVEFTLLHEIGHALIHQFPIPVFGQEEDAADQIATTFMIVRHNADVDLAAINKLLMVSSEWLSEWENEEQGPEANAHAFWDSHSLAIQRFYNVNCLLFGSNPDELSFLFDTKMLPAERGFDCEQAYAQAFEANFWLLDTFGRGEDSLVPFNGIVVEYAQTRDPRHEKVRTWMVGSGMVQELTGRATELFPWRKPVRLLFENCPGSAEAYYNRNVAEIVVCYELLDLFLEQSEASLDRSADVVCTNVGLRRLYGHRFGCVSTAKP
jgi:putative metallopeptidase DUF4344